MDSRYVVAIVGLLASVLVSVIAWVAFDTIVLFLLIPFVPLVWWRVDGSESRPVRRCPQCGFSTTTPGYDYCPRDGTRLESTVSDGPGHR